jgi:hypothetical protein
MLRLALQYAGVTHLGRHIGTAVKSGKDEMRNPMSDFFEKKTGVQR